MRSWFQAFAFRKRCLHRYAAVDYRERASAYGHIPGTFNKREGAPKDREILAMRVLDRAVGAGCGL